MIRKSAVASVIFILLFCYTASPWVLERTFFLNELLAGAGFIILIYKSFSVKTDRLSLAVLGLLLWSVVHLLTSLFRMDGLYFYLRNTVIIYSVFAYFTGYYTFRYLPAFIQKTSGLLKGYTLVFMAFPSPLFFERFGMSTLFPALLPAREGKASFGLLILLNLAYAIVYSSSTIAILTLFYIFLGSCSRYNIFKWIMLSAGVIFTVVFIYLVPYMENIRYYTPFNYNSVLKVMNSHPLLSFDHNNSWRLIFWKQVIIDAFPSNLFGVGLGTPLIRYFPVEDFGKFDTLPYVFGAHNSYIYLFGRLGLPYVAITIYIYHRIFSEYFRYKAYYYHNRSIRYFWSFFAISVTAFFNPVLESPIFASLYWILLGFLAHAIRNREGSALHLNNESIEDPIHS